MNIYDEYLELIQSTKHHLQEAPGSWLFSSPEVLNHFRLVYKPASPTPTEKPKAATLPKPLPPKKWTEPATPPATPKKSEEPKKEWELQSLPEEKRELQPVLDWLRKEGRPFTLKATPLAYSPPQRVLILTGPLSEEESLFLAKIGEALIQRGAPTEVHSAQTEEEATFWCQKMEWRLVLSSWSLPGVLPLETPLTWMSDTTKKKALWSVLCQKLQLK